MDDNDNNTANEAEPNSGDQPVGPDPTWMEFERARIDNESRVSGSIVEKTVAFVEGYMRPQMVVLSDPVTGDPAVFAIGKDGVDGVSPSYFDDWRTNPVRRKGTALMLTLDSFIDFTNRFGDDDSAVFANNDRAQPSLTAVIDYHEKGQGAPRHGGHRAKFAFPLSDEWKAWTGNDGDQMNMVEFATFLESHIVDVLPPSSIALSEAAEQFVETLGGRKRIADPAKLMEIATGLQVYENSVVKNATRLQSGESVVEFQSEHVDAQGNKLTLPSMFVLGIPVFRGGERYQVLARLRYRKGSGIVFWFDLWRTDLIFDTAFEEAIERVKAETSAQVFFGAPEA